MAFAEYPKALYLRGWEDLSAYRRVLNAAEEDAARIEGWKTLPEFAHPDGLAAPKPEPVVTVEIPVAADTPPSAVNDAAREMMAEIKSPPKPDRFAAARAAKRAKKAG